jgi:hypothetical protein
MVEMMQFAAGAAAVKELASVLADVVEDPDTYKKLDALRQFIEKVTGKEIEPNAFVALLETTTQGEPYTGKWEHIDCSSVRGDSRRLRVAGGYLYHVVGSNPVFVPDK